MRRFAFIVLLAFVSLAGFSAAYTDRAFWLDVSVQPLGGAHVIEKTLLNLDTQSELDAFDFVVREGRTNLGGWQKFSRNIRYHLTGSVFNVSIVGTREFGTSFTSASVTIEYDIENLTSFQPVSSRKTTYRVDTNRIVLGSTPGEFRLEKNSIFSLHLPPDAVQVRVSPEAGTTRDGTIVRWVGSTVGTWSIMFAREISLADEVNAFFASGYQSLASSGVLWLLLVFALAVVAYKVVQSRRAS
ncbi:hypothetical protein HYV43_06865 [Candidatus Micrarchaeota archaeon]|nr:hypothetical protein [Candidatus Micrarchaeota archaeon]